MPMKYRYKDTEVIVESGIPLDSAVFTQIKDGEKKETKPVPEKPAVHKSTGKTKR